MNPNITLPESVARKLRAIRRRSIALTLAEGVLLFLAVFLGALSVAMIVDWAVGWFSHGARFICTLLALATAASALVWWCLRPLARKRTIASTARELDFLMPQLQERWSTVTELAQNQDAPAVRGSEAMIRKVTEEAEATGPSVNPAALISPRPIYKAGRWLGAAAALLVLLFLVNFTQANLLFQRFWKPGKNISLTQVKAAPADGWVPKGETLTLQATLRGRIPATPPTLHIRTQSGRTETAMTAKTGATNSFQHSIDNISDSIEFRVRAADGQTPWHRITAVDRPKISEVKLKITPPAYSNLPQEEKNALPHAVRVLEGSDIEVGFRADQPLDRMVLDFGDGASIQLSSNGDDWYLFRLRPTNSFSLAAAAINRFQLESKAKPSCRFTVYEDLAPTVSVLEPSDDFAVAPGDKVNVTFEARDDFGLAQAELIVTTLQTDGTTNLFTLPVPLGEDQGARQSRQTVELDLHALGLKHGDQLSYVVQVTDTKASLAQASSDTDSSSNQASAPQPDAGEQPSAESSSEEQQADSAPQLAETGSSKPSQTEPNDNSDARQNTSTQTHDMAKRTLDAGQSAACEPRNINVDESVGKFDAERRAKLEIAIEPILRRLDELLAHAQQTTASLQAATASAEGLISNHAEPLAGATGKLTGAEETVRELNERTSGTPYAFVGLQLRNISQAHIVPARASLGRVAIASPTPATNAAEIERASFHIARARELLADLTRTYESVKRNEQVADAMQRLNKMYQVFIEDTQALLGSGEAPLNSYDRKIAEVDEQFVEKLRELLEEKKKIMAELAELLAEDPRLLRRYLAMLELQSTSYRDQLTLLSQRQDQLQKQLAQWNGASEPGRGPLLEQFQENYKPRQQHITRDATKLRENMETWLPLDVALDQIEPALRHAERVVQLMADGGPETDAQTQALTELRALRESLPLLNEIQSTNTARMAAYIANRMVEVESLITAQSGHIKITESFSQGDFPKVAEITQHTITMDTVTLGEKLETTEQQVASMSEEIAGKAAELTRIVESDIIPHQETSIGHLAAGEVAPASELLTGVMPAFSLAEQTFDELMRLIIAKLDEAPAPTDPGGAQDNESLLTMLEDEIKASEGLGIPCRPINVAVNRDWTRPGSSGSGPGMGQAQAQAAQAQAQQHQAQTDRLEREARRGAQRALAQAREQAPAPNPATAQARQRGEDWNKLVSKLQKDLLQGRDNTPPEQYREAIDNYFKVISDPATEIPR